MKQVSSLHSSDPPLLLSHSAASTSCDSRLEEQLAAAVHHHQLNADDDDLLPDYSGSHYMMQHRYSLSPQQLAGRKDVALHQRVILPVAVQTVAYITRTVTEH